MLKVSNTTKMTHIYQRLPCDVQEVVLKHIFVRDVEENTRGMIRSFIESYDHAESSWDIFNADCFLDVSPEDYIISPDDILVYKPTTYNWEVKIRLDFAAIHNLFYEFVNDFDPLGEHYLKIRYDANESITYADMAYLLDCEIKRYLDYLEDHGIDFIYPMNITDISLTPYQGSDVTYEGYYDLDFEGI